MKILEIICKNPKDPLKIIEKLKKSLKNLENL